MKLRFSLSALAAGLLCTGAVFAQDTQGAPDNSQQGTGRQQHGFLSSLSAQDKMKFIKARQQVLANNPDLKAEQEDLTRQRQALKSQGSNASQNDRKTFFQNMMAHEKKMREALLQVDPSLSSVFDQIDQQMKGKFHQRGNQGNEN
jgi:hypothetical protein